MKLLDLFCGAGGAAMGYYRAGFTEIVGVDNVFQKRYPFNFIQSDWFDYLIGYSSEFDLIHASPPCQLYSVTASLTTREYFDLIGLVREQLRLIGKPYVIENVPGAPLDNPLMLCGSMFGLKVIRHRLFECSPTIWFAPHTCCCRALYTHSGHGQHSSFKEGATAITVVGNNFDVSDGKVAMDIDWMTGKELAQAIPPAYTKWLGKQIIRERKNE